MARGKSVLDQDTHVAELTSFQLIVGICLALVVCLACFLLGIVVGRLESGTSIASSVTEVVDRVTGRSSGTEGSAGPAATAASTTNPAGKGPRTTIVQAPSPDAAPAAAPATPAPAPAPAQPTATPSPVSPTPASEPVASAAAPRVQQTALPAGTAAPARPEVREPSDTVVAAAETAAPRSTASPADTATKPAAEPKTATAAKAGGFTVQVVAYESKNRGRAEEYKRLLEKNSDLKAQLVPSEDGKFVRVYVGRYATRAEAQKACEELRKRAGFQGCFVKAL